MPPFLQKGSATNCSRAIYCCLSTGRLGGRLVSISRPIEIGLTSGRARALVGSSFGPTSLATVTAPGGWSLRGPEDAAPCRSAKASAGGRATVLACRQAVTGVSPVGCIKIHVAG